MPSGWLHEPEGPILVLARNDLAGRMAGHAVD
jgi:hypothetical protein